MILDKNKEKKEWSKHAFERKIKYIYDVKNQNVMTCIHENKVNKVAENFLLHDILKPSICA